MFKEIEETIKTVYGNQALKKTQLFEIIKEVKKGKPTANQGLCNGKRKVQDPTFIANVATQVASDRCFTIPKLALAHGVSTKTIHATLHEDPHLSKESARWVPKLLNQMKNERIRICEAFLAMVRHHSMAMLDQAVTMDESMVPFHTP
jgi:hypothetical protein